FDASGAARCWAGFDEFVSGDASGSGIESDDGKMKVFTGVRNDPFFFNLPGLKKVEEIVGRAPPSLNFRAARRPHCGAATAGALVTALGTGKDDFLGFNAFASVVQLDKTVLTRDGPIVSVWGSTHRKAS